ncbi:hypothetical protein K458DRAFT_483416 [Lentithecium fluviatile CBS 122367]|uniref:Uncharacterized protein n=1 Tax=Lentithecium fluviatile CBS 122367 TaxID=1168545 RepID=A0A6G1JGZ9_9PLEO|nr:hypothetical protein K458DRAFT_483416 [Lentithecium fluviatile CBS 122367]
MSLKNPADPAPQQTTNNPTDETSDGEMQIEWENIHYNPMSDAPSAASEYDAMTGAYFQKWLCDEESDLQELGQIAGIPQAPTSGFLKKQGWHSINDPGVPHTPNSMPKDELALTEYLNIGDGDGLDGNYFDPTYYLGKQGYREPEQAPDRARNRIIEAHQPGNDNINDSDTSQPKQVHFLLDDSTSDLSDVPEDLSDRSEETTTATTLQSVIKGTVNRRPVLSVSKVVAFNRPVRISKVEDVHRGIKSAESKRSGLSKIVKKVSGAKRRLDRKESGPTAKKSSESTLDGSNNVGDKESDHQSNEGGWELVTGDVSSPTQGTPANEKLTIHLRHTISKEEKKFEFTNIRREDIDWTNHEHIKIIAHWRRQILRRGGFEKKKVNILYTPNEDAWLELFHKKLKLAAQKGHAIEMPSIPMIGESFNRFFAGKVFQDTNGKILPPREAREMTSFQGKFNRKTAGVHDIREEAKALVDKINSRNRKVYIPTITDSELQQYLKSGAAASDNPDIEAKNAASLIPDEKLDRHLHQMNGQRKRKRETGDEDEDGDGGSVENSGKDSGT